MTETELAEIPQPRVGKALNSNWVVSGRWSPRSAWLGVAGLAVPTGAHFWFIHQYAVNVIYCDQWSDVSLLDHLYAEL